MFPLEGGCDCGYVRYRMETAPLFVHCCHCRWCQRESGASFALNAMIEAERVTHLAAEPELVNTPSESGSGQNIARCPKCRIAVWSNYSGAGRLVRFVRVGTLDTPDVLPPNIHIFTASKQPGWSSRPVCRPCPSTTIAKATGPRRVWLAARPCCRKSRLTKRLFVATRRLTLPSTGRPQAGFAHLRPPLMSNARIHE